MNRSLQYINSIGVLALAVLCVFQWQANRRFNMEANRLEKIRIEQAAQIQDQSQKLKGYTDDLESFRGQLTRANVNAGETEKKQIAAERQLQQLKLESEQLKASVTNWAEAVAARDERLKEANQRIVDLSAQLNTNILSYNKLATNYNAVVSQLNALRNPAKQEETPK